MKVILYSTNCPKCNVLKQKLKNKGIEFTENNSVDEMLKLGITEVPMLGVNGLIMSFKQAVLWINKQ